MRDVLQLPSWSPNRRFVLVITSVISQTVHSRWQAICLSERQTSSTVACMDEQVVDMNAPSHLKFAAPGNQDMTSISATDRRIRNNDMANSNKTAGVPWMLSWRRVSIAIVVRQMPITAMLVVDLTRTRSERCTPTQAQRQGSCYSARSNYTSRDSAPVASSIHTLS